MGSPQPTAPDAASVVSSLASAADVARQAYLAALNANPTADLSQLYKKEMEALALWSDAENKALNNDPAVRTAQTNLDAATKNIRNQLPTIKEINQCLGLLDNLVNLASTVGKFFITP